MERRQLAHPLARRVGERQRRDASGGVCAAYGDGNRSAQLDGVSANVRVSWREVLSVHRLQSVEGLKSARVVLADPIGSQ